MSKLRVAMVTPPWLALPIKGYGGIELVVEGLVQGLREHGVEVEIFGNGARKMNGIKTHSLYKTEQFEHIEKPYYETAPIIQAHMLFALNKIQEDGKFDIIHDHNTLIGPVLLSYATRDNTLPPAVHTLHGPPFSNDQMLAKGQPDNKPQFQQLKDMGKTYVISISESMKRSMPSNMKPHALDAVHNAIDINSFPFVENKRDYYITLARFTADKGQHAAARFAQKHRKRLRMAGTVAGIGTNSKLLAELANPLSSYRNNEAFRYYSDKVLKYVLNNPQITYAGNLSGRAKMKFISEAKALLFPIDWEEPFGMAVIEAMACGTPVVAMNRGAMPEIIEHGVNGFLANSREEFEDYALRVDEIDPKACRESVAKRFTASAMAAKYIERYEEAIRRSRDL